MESGALARVLNDFFTTVDGELTLCKGEHFLVHKVLDKHWCYGQCHDRVGKFPTNYLHKIQLAGLQDSERVFVSIADFAGEQNGDLSFSNGEVIIGVQDVGSGWYSGYIEERKGIFPISRTWEVNRALLKRVSEMKILQRKARVIASLTAQLEGELELNVGDIITVSKVLQDGWCYGLKEDGAQGTFPEDFVTFLSDDMTDTCKNPLHFPEDFNDSSINVITDDKVGLEPTDPADSIPKYNDLFPQSSLGSSKSSEISIPCGTDFCASNSIQPCAITLYTFEAEFPNELSFQAGEMIFLSRYIDVEWLEGAKKDGVRGIFPASYVDIIVSGIDSSAKNGEIEEGGEYGHELGVALDNKQTNDESRADSPTDNLFQDFVILRNSENHCGASRRISEPHRSAPSPPSPPSRLHGKDVSFVDDSKEKRRAKQIGINLDSDANGKDKRADQRQNVISELVLTEREYVRGLKLTYQLFRLHEPTFLESRGIDVATLFGNILDVILTAEQLLDMILQGMKGIAEEEQKIGPCFIKMAEQLQSSYVKYCGNHEAALILLRKYEANEEIVNIFNKAIDSLRCQMACFDMSSILIKPVQRILKYPLILRKLEQFTDDDHQDKKFIEEACATMARVADYINESKRRKDLVCKYLESENTLRKRIANLNMHSVAKISTRLSTKLSASFGLTNIPAHPEFEELERSFHSIEKCTWQLSKDVEQSLAYLNLEALSGEVISDILFQYYQGVSNAETQKLRDIRSAVRSLLLKDLKSAIETRVSAPISLLSSLLEGPAVLILKRQDKMLDYDAAISKSEKYRDSRIVQDELTSTKCNFEALTEQLLEELPALVDAATKILAQCIGAFAHARKLLNGKVTQRYLSLCEGSPQLSQQDILESFIINHNYLWNQMTRFAFAGMSVPSQPEEQPSFLQTEAQRIALKSKYPDEKLYIVTDSVQIATSLDVGACKGTLVAVMKQQDPMGNVSRWFVDNGVAKGFLPASKLSPIRPWATHQSEAAPNTPDLISMDSPEKQRDNNGPSKTYFQDLLSLSADPSEDAANTASNQFYYALFDFNTNLPGTLSINQGQVIRLLRSHDEKGNDEWWYVEDRNQYSGYVPSNYLKVLPPRDH